MKLCAACGSGINAPEWVCPSCHWRADTRDRVTSLLGANEQTVGGFSATHFSDLEAVEPRHFWFAARNRLIAWALNRYFPRAETLLEVGCGTGQVLQALRLARPHLRLTASELSLAGLHRLAGQLPDVELVQADTRHLPYDQHFDVVCAFDVLEHIAEHEAAMREIARTVRRNGGVLLTVPQHPTLWSPLDDYSGHLRRYTRTELVALVGRAGLRILRVTSFVSLLLPALVASRVAQRGASVDPKREYRINRVVNATAAAAMMLERLLIAAGVSFPVGGSLLVVARR